VTAIHAILIVPAEGDPHNLLAEGPCGARPPVLGEVEIAHARSGDAGLDSEHWALAVLGWRPFPWVYTTEYPECRRGLVLALDGAPLRRGMVDIPATGDGWDGANYADIIVAIVYALQGDTQNLCELLKDLGTIVLLDAEGREVGLPT